MIKALVFDFDGLIVDTEMSSYQTWQEIYAEHDCQLPFSTWAICIGGCEEIRLRRRQQHIRMVEAQPVLPGVEDYILSAKRIGLKIGVASSSRHEWVDTHLTRLGLIDYFDSVKCFDDVKRTKPDPELYLAVLDALGVHGQQAIALEDSPNGVIAAQQAGIFCVAVPNPVTSQLSLLHADLCLSSLTEVSLEQLLAKVRGTVKHEHIH